MSNDERQYHTSADDRAAIKSRHDRLRAANKCINGPEVGNVSIRSGIEHGPVVSGGRCQRCVDAKKNGRQFKCRLFPIDAKLARIPINLTGHTFGRLSVSRLDGRAPDGSNLWLCVCECGTECRVRATNLRSGKTRSCGCLVIDRARGTMSSRWMDWTSMSERLRRLERIVEEQRLRLDALAELVEMRGRRAA